MLVRAGEKVVLNFWRVCDKEYVWYEWQLQQPQVLRIQGPSMNNFIISLHFGLYQPAFWL